MKLGYVCTNYNNSAVTVDAVKTLLANRGHEIRIAVVDNASQQPARDLLRDALCGVPEVTLIFNEENLGYFAGLNTGLRALRALDPGIEWMVVGNNDLLFDADFCDRVEQHSAALGAYPVISPDIVTEDGEHQNPHVISGIGRFREFMYDVYYSNYYVGRLVLLAARLLRSLVDRPDELQWRVEQTIYQGHGSCYLLTPRYFRLFTELPARTFLVYEEYFLSLQLSEAGEKLLYTPALRVTHRWHSTLSQLPSRTWWALAKASHKEYRKYVRVLG
ncbi:glycosyltransferase family 2 protein [Ramlibacter albus]|uniref:Glycosyltransferase family 2 protein n=1 Tax=Ramlibacter albus TaxID=2079448 RepID=A0A923MBH3_9BURK|nr:glycosyltransferase [Ramlibacter albus]MBC5766930.1 glycosyltransferase family 2 protein [Ramlibacter albus]